MWVAFGPSSQGRDLTPDELPGELVGQTERLAIDRYKREHPQEQPTTPVAHESRWQPVVVQGSAMAFDAGRDPPPDNVTEFNSVRALLADIKKSQPLVPAGPSQNGVHSEPNPA